MTAYFTNAQVNQTGSPAMMILAYMKEKLEQIKRRGGREWTYVQEHPGTRAISAYMQMLFRKENPAYVWLKENHRQLYPVIRATSVQLCTLNTETGKFVPVGNFFFREMYEWYGLDPEEGYLRLHNCAELEALEASITESVAKLPHIRCGAGFSLRRFG